MSNKKAFDAKRNNTFSFDPDEVIIVGGDGPNDVPVPTADTDPQVAACYDPDVHLPLPAGFVENVDHFGVIQPVSIVKIAGQAYVVDGRTRVRAAREAKRRQLARGEQFTILVECKNVGAAREGRLLAIMITTNETRRTTSPLSKIEKMERLRERGATDDDLALAFNVSTKTIENWTAISGASSVVKKAVEAGKLSASSAVKIAQIEGVDLQRAAIEQLTASGEKPARNAVRRAVATAKGEDADNLGISSRRLQRKMYDVAKGTDGDDQDPYWDGFHDALAVVLGLRPFRNAKHARYAIKATTGKKEA